MMQAMTDAVEQKQARELEKTVAMAQAPPKRDLAAQKADTHQDGKGNRSPRTRRSNRLSENAARVEPAEEVAFASPVREPRVAAIPAPSAITPAQPPQEEIAYTPPAPTPDIQVTRRADVPTVRVRKTIWHPRPDRREAVVAFGADGETLNLKEGDAIGPLVVKSIKPGGILFHHEGVEIRYNVGD
jgi:hypothetical protein